MINVSKLRKKKIYRLPLLKNYKIKINNLLINSKLLKVKKMNKKQPKKKLMQSNIQ